MKPFTYKIENKNGILVFYLSGDLLSKESALDLLNDTEKNISDTCNKILVNLSGMDHVNSNGLNVLLQLLTKTRNNGGDLIITNIPAKLKKLLVITKLTSLITIEDDFDRGLKMLSKLND